MIYRVVIQPPAQADIEATYLRIAAEAPETAARWYNGLIDAIESLSLRHWAQQTMSAKKIQPP